MGLACAAYIYFKDTPVEVAKRYIRPDTEIGEVAVTVGIVLGAGLFVWLTTSLIGWVVVGFVPSSRKRAEAQNTKAIKYRDGEGKEQDFERAAWLFRKAAEAGHWNAQLNLGCLYGTGRGVPKDDVQCYLWWDLAAKAGSTRAQRGCDILARRMTPADLRLARAQSDRLSDPEC